MGDADAFSFGLGEPVDELQWGLDADRRTLRRGHRALLQAREMAMPGLHNVANGLAAHALATSIGLDAAPLAQALREFH